MQAEFIDYPPILDQVQRTTRSNCTQTLDLLTVKTVLTGSKDDPFEDIFLTAGAYPLPTFVCVQAKHTADKPHMSPDLAWAVSLENMVDNQAISNWLHA